MSAPIAVNGASGKQRTFLGHPLGLYVLFFTEMWERFSYYGMRGLLMLYMVNYFWMTQQEASRIYKWYTGLVYLTPLAGGYLADRYLGNKVAVIIGATLMAIGHFLMAWPTQMGFYTALVFLILGNGFFKPNASTQVGRLYPANDPRRDGAYTIFYMGINLGAFLSPLVCGWLADHTRGKYHSGFAAAGIGMVAGLVIYLLGQPWVRETDASLPHASDGDTAAPAAHGATLSEAQAEQTPSALPLLNRLTPRLLVGLGCVLAVATPLLASLKPAGWRLVLTMPGEGLLSMDSVIALEIAAVCSLISAWITSQVQQAVRDRILAIYILGIFVVIFWAAYEQAGNVLNLWADKETDRVVGADAPEPPLFPTPEKETESASDTAHEPGVWERLLTMFQVESDSETSQAEKTGQGFTIPTTWFQSINALAIIVLAPLFAFLWTFLERHQCDLSIPGKMATGVLLMSLSVAIMLGAARQEDRPSSAPLREETLPPQIGLNQEQQLCPRKPNNQELDEPFDAGRLVYDPATHQLAVRGILTDLERNRILRATAPADYVQKVEQLQKLAAEAPSRKFAVSVHLDHVPADFENGMKYTGFNRQQVSYDPATQSVTARKRLEDQDIKALQVAGGDSGLRATLDDLMARSSVYRVSPWWLFWSYILATLAELCLSPVGLSMVSKLAPARFATMLMGLWLVTSFFGNFMAGAIGERWDTVAPTAFFLILALVVAVASLVLFAIIRKVVALMHGVS